MGKAFLWRDSVPFTMKRSDALYLIEQEGEKEEERRPARGAGSLWRRRRKTRPETQQKEEKLLGANRKRVGL